MVTTDIIATAAMMAGLDVKKSEVHGMAQRGGSVVSHVKIGKRVYSPIVNPEEADFVIGLEALEGIRYLPYLKKTGRAIVNTRRIPPLTVILGQQRYPDLEAYSKQNVTWVPAFEIAKRCGLERSENMVMLGVLSKFLDLPFEKAIEKRLKKFTEKNLTAFRSGKELSIG